jgi:hypothetical protein
MGDQYSRRQRTESLRSPFGSNAPLHLRLGLADAGARHLQVDVARQVLAAGHAQAHAGFLAHVETVEPHKVARRAGDVERGPAGQLRQ